MRGLTIHGSTTTNQLQVTIPDELKGIELQIIIIPAEKKAEQEIEFFSETELGMLSKMNLGSVLSDNEDYTKW